MTKRKITYAATKGLFLLFAFSFLLSSCSQEEDFAPQEQEEIRVAFTTDAIQTRVSYSEDGTTTFDNGNEVKLLKISTDQQGNNNPTDYKLTASVDNGVTTWTPDKKLYWDGKGEHTLIASYPNMDLNYNSFNIPNDQSTLENLKKADCMNARWNGSPTSEPISLNLKHRLSMVTVTYKLASEFDSDVEITTPEVYSKTAYIRFKNADGLPRNTQGYQEEAWVKAYKHSENKFTAIVSPDAYAASDEFIHVTIGGRELIAKMKEAITFAEGTHYTFNLTVGKNKVTIEQASMEDFEDPFGDGWINEEDLN